MASPSETPHAQPHAPASSPSASFETSDAELQRFTEARDKASGDERDRLEAEVRLAQGKRQFQRDKKERQRRAAQEKLVEGEGSVLDVGNGEEGKEKEGEK